MSDEQLTPSPYSSSPGDKPKIICDSREKPLHRFFWPEDYWFSGTEIRKLATADYTVEGYESKILIDRKKSITELSTNLTDKRFVRELERLANVETAVILCQFGIEDVENWPASSGLPWKKRKLIRTSAPFLLKRIVEYEKEFGVAFVFAGQDAQQVAYEMLKEALLANPSPTPPREENYHAQIPNRRQSN